MEGTPYAAENFGIQPKDNPLNTILKKALLERSAMCTGLVGYGEQVV